MDFIIQNWKELIWSPLVGITVWYFTKRNLQKTSEDKSRASVTGDNLGNITVNFKVYQDLINDLEERFKKKINDLEEDLNKMKILNEELKRAISNQERYIKKLKAKLDSYEMEGKN